MKRIFLILPIFCFFSGCATQQLAFTTKQQIRSQNDIYIQQVLENLAATTSDPTALPHFTLLQNGVPSVGDKGTITIGSLTFPARTMVDELRGARGGDLGPLGAERAVGSNWTIIPINDPDRLAAMRLLYLWILGKPIVNVAGADELLKRYVGEEFSLAKVPQGWFKCGGKHDVPEDACKVFHVHKEYFWIQPGMEEHLTLTTLTILAIATANPAPKPVQSIEWLYDAKHGTEAVKVTRVIPDPGNDAPTVIPRNPISFKKEPVPPTGHTKVDARPRSWILDSLATEAPGHTLETDLPLTPSGNASNFVDRVNNYSSQPLISPGLFSQPGMR